jgi:segregation and condensation protein A
VENENERGQGDPRPGTGAGEPGSLPDSGAGPEGDRSPSLNGTQAPAAEENGKKVFSENDLPIKAREVMHVSLPVYDGPLELLLELIKKNEMDIYDIQISVITQQYLESLAQMRQLDLEVAGEYLVLAATLLYIKSKMLLPQEEGDEEEDGLDPRSELIRKLLEYLAFKEAAKELGFLESERGKVFTRQISDYYLAQLDPEDVGIDTFSASLFDLLTAFQGVLSKIGVKKPHEVFEQVITIEQMIAEIKGRLEREKKVVFSSLFSENWTRNYLIATFLAVLEIVRNRFARVGQDAIFGEIVIEMAEPAESPE